MEPELKEKDETERRTHSVEMRVKDASYGKKTSTMEGYAANFNMLSENLGGFREILMPGCFKNAIANSDVRGLFNHNPDKILGRNTSGTLRLSEDEKGLRFEIDPPETSYSKDLQVSMQRGDVSQCSFGFKVAEDGANWAKDTDGLWIRTVTNVERLYDVSPVTYPAYTQTSCAVRSMLAQQNELEDKEKREKDEAEEKERLRKVEVRRKQLELAERSVPVSFEKRVDMGYAGYDKCGTCSMCAQENCLCSDCENKDWCNMKTKEDDGCCTKCLSPGCKCLDCVNTDKCKMKQMYNM